MTGIEPLEAWSALARERFGLAVTTGFYSAQSFPDRAFDLILMSHVIEHLPDPQPILAATKSHLALGGRLFIGTPNVVLPKLTPSIGSFNAAHVRLYSLNTLSRLLAGSGFRASASINLWPSYGLAVLAEPSEGAAPMMTADDANAVADLYDGLLQRKSGIHPDGATPLSRNLAALHPGRPDLVQLLCGHIEFRPYRLVAQPGDPTLALVEETSAGARSMEIEPDESGIAALMRSAFARGRIVVTGRGWWKTAVIALAHLREGQRMIIREPDPRIFKLAFMARDLSHVLSSSRVAVEIGSGPAQKYRQGPEPAGECHAVIRDGRPNSLNPVPVLSGEV
ncbi:MAG: methyltransferase domain-containing protein [Nitrospirae bacterium]|nr:methyltransferase domain-containing protein [Nitrospirota bacterium]